MPSKFSPKFGDVMWCFHITFMQNYLLAIGDFELYTNFSNLVQQVFLHCNPFKYFFKNSSSVWRWQWMHTIHLQAKTQWCSLENLSGSTSFAFWSNLVICTATIFFLALMTLSFLLLEALPTKLLSPGDWAHWGFWSACSKPLFFLPKTGVLQNLHYQLSVFAKLILPPSHAYKETLIWRFWPLQELPKCI